jgi:hypothetical protein
MDDLHEHIQQCFSEFMGYDRLDDQLVLWCWRRQAANSERCKDYYKAHRRELRKKAREAYYANRAAVLARQAERRAAVPVDPVLSYERTKAWRKANPDKQRALSVRQKKRYFAKYPEKQRARKQRYRDKHREHVRDVNRRNQAARRARLKAEKQKEVV